MGTDLDKPLTTAERGAAALDAEGLKTADIARALDVTPATIRSWRQKALYSVAVEQYGKQAQQDLQPLVNRVRTQLAVAVSEAVATLLDNLQAEDEDGHPYYSVRQAAAASLLAHVPQVLGRPSGGSEGEGSRAGAAAQAVIEVNLDGRPLPKVIDVKAAEE